MATGRFGDSELGRLLRGILVVVAAGLMVALAASRVQVPVCVVWVVLSRVFWLWLCAAF